MRSFSRFWALILFGFSFLLLLSSTSFAGGNGRISGNIKGISGIPLADAVIKIFREVQQGDAFSIVRSDKHGFFKSASLTPDTYYLQVSRQGYKPFTSSSFAIDSGRTTSLDIVLQNLIDYLSNEDDPRNWDLKTVMRSSSDRRLIFRNLPGEIAPEFEDKNSPFSRSGAMSLASGSVLSGGSYLVRPQTGQNGVTSNFAFAEPLSQHSRMILSGQLDFGNDSFWRVRNSFNYRPDNDHDYRLSVGYGRMNISYPAVGSISSQLFAQESDFRESGLQTLALGMEGNTKFLDILAIKYGFDYSRLHYAEDKSFFYPSLEILVTPSKYWRVKTSFSSQRVSDTNTVVLPDGEQLNLSEPTLITMVDNRVSMSQIRHSEIAAQREIDSDTAIEVAVYQDQTRGPGLPLMVTTITPTERRSSVIELNEDRSRQRGTRIRLNHKFLDVLSGSVSYVYGAATNLSNIEEPIPGNMLDAKFIKNYASQSYHHSITGQIDATVPSTGTNLLATVRWYPGNPVTPIDWFSDRMDIGSKSVNFEIRQSIPVPEFLMNSGRWEILIDLRNILNQGKETMATPDGQLVLNRNPRSLRFGLSLNFH
jgi:hypothetical protein